MSASLIIGPSLDVLRTLPAASVDLVLTSPPFLALRSYLPADHPHKALEVGSEPTPGEFIDALLDHVEECARVLAPHGSLVFELGDTYSGSGGAGGDYGSQGLRDGQPKFGGSNGRRNRPADVAAGILAPTLRPGPEGRDHMDGWPLDKSLCLIPEIFRFALVYGFNPLTGRQTPPWRGRNVIRWCRPNPPVGALGDKVRPGTSDMVVVCKGRTRYFDLDAIRAPATDQPRTVSVGKASASKGISGGDSGNPDKERMSHNAAGAPPLDHWWHDEDTFDQDAWLIPTHGYRGAHYATWPPALLVKPILAMCPQLVCTTCGKPSERIVVAQLVGLGGTRGTKADELGNTTTMERTARATTTVGWTDCGCGDGCRPTTWKVEVTEVPQGKASDGEWYDLDEWPDGADPVAMRTKRKRKRLLDDLGACAHGLDTPDTHWRRGVVLDPFVGTGTTLVVATGHGRDAIGIDLDARNADLACQRVGMFLEVIDSRAVVA